MNIPTLVDGKLLVYHDKVTHFGEKWLTEHAVPCAGCKKPFTFGDRVDTGQTRIYHADRKAYGVRHQPDESCKTADRAAATTTVRARATLAAEAPTPAVLESAYREARRQFDRATRQEAGAVVSETKHLEHLQLDSDTAAFVLEAIITASRAAMTNMHLSWDVDIRKVVDERWFGQ